MSVPRITQQLTELLTQGKAAPLECRVTRITKIKKQLRDWQPRALHIHKIYHGVREGMKKANREKSNTGNRKYCYDL